MTKKCLFFFVFILTSFGWADSMEMTRGATLLQEISKAFAEIADHAKPATVSIKCKSYLDPSTSNPQTMFEDEFFRRFFRHSIPQNPQPQERISGGSGFIISEDGFIVTNSHVIDKAKEVTVTLSDGREFEATVIGSDTRTELAVIRIEGNDFPFLNFGDSDELSVGEWVVAAGNPFGLEGTITQGIVSAKGRQDLGIAAYEDFIQTDAVINPGNSGGPLLNVRGEVVGVNTAILSRSGGFMGVGLAIPSRMVQPIIDQIIRGGSVKRAYLGIVLQPVDKALSNALGLDKPEGILISDIVKGSPADEAGLQQGDIIVEYDGKIIKNMNKFRNDVAMMAPGSTIRLKVLRNHKIERIEVCLGCRNDGEEITLELINKIGIELENLTPELSAKYGYGNDVHGVMISSVKPGSAAAMAGLRPSFLITGVALDWNNQKPVQNITELNEALGELGDKNYVILIVRNQNFQRFYTVKIK